MTSQRSMAVAAAAAAVLGATVLPVLAGAGAASAPARTIQRPAATPMNAATGIVGLHTAYRRADGALVVRGRLSGRGVIADLGTRVIEGTVAPGNSPGCVTDQGNVVFEGSALLEIELGGATACTGFDQYSVNQSLTLNGPTLRVLLINGFVPAAGQRFDVLNWGTLGGRFGMLELPALPHGLTWDTSALYSAGELVVAGPNAAQDGDVPLPAWALLMLGGGLMAALTRRQR